MRPLFVVRFVVLPLSLLLAGCNREPVLWQDQSEMPSRHPSPAAFPTFAPTDSSLPDSASVVQFQHTQDLLREAGATSLLASVVQAMPAAQAVVTPSPMAPMTAMAVAANHDLGTDDAPRDSARCARSLRIVAAPSRGRVAVWWTRRSHGRVALVAAWRLNRADDSAAVWRGPIDVDTLDQGPGDANATERGAVGCDRAAPGVAVDEKNGYVHVAYALNAPEGPGIFYAHQMDPRASFEPPVVIVYGDRRLGAVRVAAAGDMVVVAYEDPNAPLDRGRIGLALSRTSGHIFEERMNASHEGRAADPYVVVRGRAVVVGWTDVDVTENVLTAFRMRRGTVR